LLITFVHSKSLPLYAAIAELSEEADIPALLSRIPVQYRKHSSHSTLSRSKLAGAHFADNATSNDAFGFF
jgi:hypothetical protein